MFENITETILWDLQPNTGVRERDIDTPQKMVDGEYRGTTERFFRIVGRLVKEVFNDISRLRDYKIEDVDKKLLKSLAATLGGQFVKPEDDIKTRMFLDTLNRAWVYKGTQAFLRWATWNIYGWKLLIIETAAVLSLRVGIFSTFLYDPHKPMEEQNILLDIERVTPLTKARAVIDIEGDINYISKRETYKVNAPEWCYISEIQFINIPPEIVPETTEIINLLGVVNE